jgi:hypothetical protein
MLLLAYWVCNGSMLFLLKLCFPLDTIVVSNGGIMVSLLIKRVPDNLHRRLRKAAKIHQHSMNQEALMVLAGAMDVLDPLPKVVRIKEPFTNAFIRNAKRG